MAWRAAPRRRHFTHRGRHASAAGPRPGGGGARTADDRAASGVQQHVAGLEVTVDDGRLVLVQEGHGLGHVRRHLQQLAPRARSGCASGRCSPPHLRH